MPESLMYLLFSDLSDIETYILNHYKITNPSENLKRPIKCNDFV